MVSTCGGKKGIRGRDEMLAAVEQKGKQGGRTWGRKKCQQIVSWAKNRSQKHRHQGHGCFQLCPSSRSWGSLLSLGKEVGTGSGQPAPALQLSWQTRTFTPKTASQQEVWNQTVWKSLRNSRGTSWDQLGHANPPGSWCQRTARPSPD